MQIKPKRALNLLLKRTFFGTSGYRDHENFSTTFVTPRDSLPAISLEQIPKTVRIPDYAQQVLTKNERNHVQNA